MENEVEKVLRIEIANAVSKGKTKVSGTIYFLHDSSKVVENLKKDGYVVTVKCLKHIVGNEYKYKISW